MKAICSTLLSISLLWYGVPSLAASARQPASQKPLSQLIQESYASLFTQAPELNLPAAEIESYRKALEREKKDQIRATRQKKDSLEDQISQAQDSLKELNQQRSQLEAAEKRRHDLHCSIQNLRKELADTELALKNGVPISYDNKLAKLRVLQEWPDEYAKLQQDIDSGAVIQRKFGDFRDIGFRPGVFDGQEKDVKDGREAVQELKRQGLLPPAVEDQEIVNYVRDLAGRLGRHSDLRVPLEVTVLKSKEINAFALPGGFLFVNTGLINEADNEAELAGVMAHEIAHVAARHGHRLMTRANIAGIIFQAAQVAALVLTGGVASIGMYYALQYGFYGLGLVLDLSLLGVSREYEEEADILGTQYLWHAGYNTRGFIDFFDKMARKKGYIQGLSWFRTHPPFYERMARAFEQIVILPPMENPTEDTPEFHKIKDHLKEVLADMEKKDRDAPTLRMVYDCEPPPSNPQ